MLESKVAPWLLSCLEILMHGISRHSWCEESVRFERFRIASLLFADDVVLHQTVTFSTHQGSLQVSAKQSG